MAITRLGLHKHNAVISVRKPIMQDLPAWKLDHWHVSRLKVNREQRKNFRARTEQEMDELEAAVRQNFLEPLDVLPDGTILAGHQRLQLAIERLKLKTIPVRIRFDLEAQGPEACQLFFLMNNLVGRQLSELEQARAYRQCIAIEAQQRKSTDPSQRPLGRVREAVAKRFGKCGRTMDDWSKILDTPQLIQSELQAGRLNLTDAIEIGKAPQAAQLEIADLIGQGVQARKAMRKVIGLRKRGPLSDDQLTRRWRDFARVSLDLVRALPHSLNAILPNQYRRLEYAIEVADSLRPFLAARSDESKANANAGATSSTSAPTATPVQHPEPVPQPNPVRRPKLLPKPTPLGKSVPGQKPKLLPRTVSPPEDDYPLGSAS